MSRDSINEGAGNLHTLSRKVLGTDWYDTESQARRGIEALEGVQQRLERALKLLKQAGDNLDIRTSQEVRALRFKILQFLEEQDGRST